MMVVFYIFDNGDVFKRGRNFPSKMQVSHRTVISNQVNKMQLLRKKQNQKEERKLSTIEKNLIRI